MIAKKPVLMQSTPILIGLFMLFLPQTTSAQQWQLQKQQGEVKVYSRPTDSNYIEIKATTTAKAKPIALIALLDDTDAAPSWIAHCKKIEIIDWFGGEERTVHSYFSAPWPLTDRDMLTFSKTRIDKRGNVHIKVSDKGDQHARLPSYVRMQRITGQWTARNIGNGKIEITYQGYGEDGGSIPVWLANHLSVRASLTTFSNLRKRISQAKYQPQNTNK